HGHFISSGNIFEKPYFVEMINYFNLVKRIRRNIFDCELAATAEELFPFHQHMTDRLPVKLYPSVTIYLNTGQVGENLLEFPFIAFGKRLYVENDRIFLDDDRPIVVINDNFLELLTLGPEQEIVLDIIGTTQHKKGIRMVAYVRHAYTV